MRVIAAILLIGVCIRHNAVNALAASTGLTPGAVFYVLGGAWEIALCAAMLAFTTALPPSTWRTIVRCAMVVGIIEGAQIGACRLAIPDIARVPTGTSLCDHVAGFPIGVAITVLYLFVIAWVLGRAVRSP
jgi:hypothetical protein